MVILPLNERLEFLEMLPELEGVELCREGCSLCFLELEEVVHRVAHATHDLVHLSLLPISLKAPHHLLLMLEIEWSKDDKAPVAGAMEIGTIWADVYIR